MSAGALLVSLLYISIFITFRLPHKIPVIWIISVFLGTGILYLHGMLSFFSSNQFDFARFWQSHLLLMLYSLGAYCLAIFAQSLSTEQADGAINFVFLALIFSVISGLMHFQPFFPAEASKSVLFHAEPSHFALDFLPMLLYVVVRSHLPIKIALLLGSLTLCLMLENLTLLVGLVLILGIVVRLHLRLLLLLLLLSPLIFVVLQVGNLEYYVERLNFSSSASNLSTLVYMQGLERAYLNLMETYFLGVGFQQFGIVGSMGGIQEQIKALHGEELNLLDGSSVASKIIGEFGMFGVLCMLLYFWYFLHSAKWLRKVSIGHGVSSDTRDVFFHCCFVMYSIDLLIRGVGYFSSSGFLFLASVCWLFVRPKMSSSEISISNGRISGGCSDHP